MLIILLALCALLGYRIYSNIATNEAKAKATTNALYVNTGKPIRKDIASTVRLPATIDAAWSAAISSEVDGRIIKMYVNVGDHVTAGQVLCQLDTTELNLAVLQAQSNLLTAQANADNAEANYQRSKKLVDAAVMSPKDFDRDKTTRDAAYGQLAVANANLRTTQSKVAFATVVAPRAAVVVERKAQEGYYAKPGETILTLADDRDVIIKKNIPENRLEEIKVGMPITLMVDAVPNKKFYGTITRLYPSAILPTRTYTSEASIANNNGELHMGMSATVYIRGVTHKNALCIPESALVVKDDQKTVYIVLPGKLVKQTLIEVGSISDGWVEVLSGLTSEDTIVLSGQNKIHDGDAIKTVGDRTGK